MKRKIRAVSITPKIDEIVENVRVKLGMDRSRFYETAIVEYLKVLSVLSATAKET